VKEPLARVLKDFRFIQLEKCGITPGSNVEAKGNFYAALRREIGSFE